MVSLNELGRFGRLLSLVSFESAPTVYGLDSSGELNLPPDNPALVTGYMDNGTRFEHLDGKTYAVEYKNGSIVSRMQV